jgi:hypothetical protein
MTRPCTCDRLPPPGEPYSTAYCRLCWLYHNDPAYKQHWDGEPSLTTKAVNFGTAIVNHVMGGMKKASSELQLIRISECQKCEFFNKEKRSCQKCGCNMDLKVSWLEQKCPIGKW